MTVKTIFNWNFQPIATSVVQSFAYNFNFNWSVQDHEEHRGILFPEMRAIARACAGTHAGKFTCAIYRTCEVIVFSLLLLLLYISRKENFLTEKFSIEYSIHEM